MSRKTKKEKLAADSRRQNQSMSYQVPLSPQNTYTPTVKGYSLPVNSINAAVTPQNNYSYVVSDLKRILVLTALAFCAQVVLWYFLGNKL